MSKAVSGAIEIAAAGALMSTGVGAGFGFSLFILGVSTEIAAAAAALSGANGVATTIRQADAPRRIIYGTQRVGAVEVFESTTGSSKSQYNMVLVFAAHEITNFLNLYLDGRQVYWAGGGTGYSTRNGIGFGGGGDGQQHIGPDGSDYTFDNATSGHSGVYADACFGDQAAGFYFTDLQANDSRWGPDSNGNTPSLMGCSAIYLKCEADANLFPTKPDARATIKGKAVYDPRTGVTAYSENWALIVADLIQNTDYGLGDAINQDQLIAAANICDEEVEFFGSGGGYEARYTCHYTWTMDKGIGDVLNDMMTGAGGRMSFIEGEWYLFPATYVAPVVSFSVANLIAKPTWSAQRRFREKINRVQGTYIAPNYPYSAAGDLYDANGWYNGTIQNNFPYAFQPTSYPTYACDATHGYPSDQYLTQDNNVELSRTTNYSTVLSITQAQRLSKIALLRNRQQGTGTLTMGVEALVLQPNDTFTFTFPQRGWTNKLLEVQRMDFSVQANSDGAPEIQVQLTVAETDPSVYVWNATDELTPYEVEAASFNPGQYVTAPPTDMTLVSSAATALVQPDGTVTPRIQITWDTPADARVASIAVQWQLTGATSWTDGGTVSASSNIAYIPAVANQQYNVQIQSVQASGATSSWVTINAFTAGLVLSVATQSGVGIGTLIGEAYSGGTAAIVCDPFSTLYGSSSVSIFPAGAVTITNDGTIGGAGGTLAQQTLYYVYYADVTLAGGNVNPIATTNQTDYLGKIGYFLIDNVTTPFAGSGVGNRYYPSTYSDVGARTTSNPTSAYDGNLSTFASVSSSVTIVLGDPEDSLPVFGDCIFQGDPAITLTGTSTLTVVAGVSKLGELGDFTCTIAGTIAGTTTTMATITAVSTSATYTLAVPANTMLNTISVEASVDPGSISGSSGTRTVTLKIYEIYVQS
jgi:hypothetical protein